MKQQVIAAIRRNQLWEPGQHVAIAVSGGADSQALALLLLATAPLHGGVLSIVTVDHGLDPASGRWIEVVAGLADHLGLPLQTHRVQVDGRSEDAARRARYAVFEKLSCDRIALGHHRDDQAETVLLNLLRGTQGRGLRGMAPRRGRYVRPLLGIGRAALRSWGELHGVQPIVDPANADPDFLRVRLRSEVLPLLEQIRPGATTALVEVGLRQAEDDAVLEGLAAQLQLTVASLGAAPRALARRRLRQALGDPTRGPIEAVLDVVDRGRGSVQLDGERVLRVADGHLVLSGPDPGPESR